MTAFAPLPAPDAPEHLGGLTTAEAHARLARYGPNLLRRMRAKSAWAILSDQFKSVIVFILVVATAFSVFTGDLIEAAAIALVLVINTAIGFSSELRGMRAMQSLRDLTVPNAVVVRDGHEQVIRSRDIVPGDRVLIAAGDIVPADLKLVEVSNLQCDESALTGESVPVAKGVGESEADADEMAFQGTAVTRGSGAGIVIATGMKTKLGRIAELAGHAQPESSPLLTQLNRLGAQLVWATATLIVVLFVMGILAGQNPEDMGKTAIALGVAAVPEGLPVVATLVLARGMWRMARRNAVVRTLSAVEALGATTVILADKTGTLTANRMTLAQLRLSAGVHDMRDPQTGDSEREMALTVAALCTADSSGAGGQADPIDAALRAAAGKAGIGRERLLEDYPEHHQVDFSHATKMMASVNRSGSGYLISVKGAPEAVIGLAVEVLAGEAARPLDDTARANWLAESSAMASAGLRVLALAFRKTDEPDAEPFAALTLIGLAGLSDPARDGVREAIAACQDAGVRVVMVTGDHKETARAIGRDVGLFGEEDTALDAAEMGDLAALEPGQEGEVIGAAVLSRVTPETKLDLVALYQRSGEVVAMTGDGVNDAPALRKADVGVAMGQRGTEVAREAADIVLRDDALGSIVAAMQQGRVTFDNIRIFVTYLLSCNLSEIAVIGFATLVGLPLPLLPLQILFLNLVTDVFPAFALGLGEGSPDVMRRPPRDPKEPLLMRDGWIAIVLYGAVITVATLGAFILARTWLGFSHAEAGTIAFVTLGLAQLLHVFNMRRASVDLFRNQVVANPFVWGALGVCTGLIAAVVEIPAAAFVIGNTMPGAAGWALAVVAAFLPLLVIQSGLGVASCRLAER
ncbi:cation-translocating P-type ATPase [Pelagibacterium halotolerans]|uniref:cation-translocating P-type ATPase n=1 Tax=Pelagibacterium halotolerans TaxID=531813 RepID=UPI0038516D76